MSNLKYTQKLKDKILHIYMDEGRTTKSLEEEFHIPRNTINYWIREHRKECEINDSKNGTNTYEELMRLRKENVELRKENSFLKKATAFFAKETM